MDQQDTIAYASAFTGDLSLWLAIVIGFIASFLVLRSAYKMGGGLFGSVLQLIGFGMTIVVIGTVTIASGPFLPEAFLDLIHTVLFSIGFILMVLGANKMIKGIMS